MLCCIKVRMAYIILVIDMLVIIKSVHRMKRSGIKEGHNVHEYAFKITHDILLCPYNNCNISFCTVIDFCLTKHMVTDPHTAFCSLQPSWASKASCNQRKGLAL